MSAGSVAIDHIRYEGEKNWGHNRDRERISPCALPPLVAFQFPRWEIRSRPRFLPISPTGYTRVESSFTTA